MDEAHSTCVAEQCCAQFCERHGGSVHTSPRQHLRPHRHLPQHLLGSSSMDEAHSTCVAEQSCAQFFERHGGSVHTSPLLRFPRPLPLRRLKLLCSSLHSDPFFEAHLVAAPLQPAQWL